jgi:hypothetical protein
MRSRFREIACTVKRSPSLSSVTMFTSQFVWFSRFLDFHENCQKYIQQASSASLY